MPLDSPSSGGESQPIFGNKPQASSNCRASFRSLAQLSSSQRWDVSNLHGGSAVDRCLQLPLGHPSGSHGDRVLHGDGGAREGWRLQGGRMESTGTSHTSLPFRLCPGCGADTAVVQRRQRSVSCPALLNEKSNFSHTLHAASFTPAANINPFCP